MAEPQDMLRFIEKFRDKVKKFCDPLIHHFGINEFFYQSESHNGKSLGINICQDWIDYYFSEQLYLIDPLRTHPNNHRDGLLTADCVKDKSTLSLLDHAKIHFEINFSFLLVNKIPDGVEFFVFGLPSPSPAHILKFYNEIKLIRAFAKRFKEAFKSEILKLEDYRIDMIKLKGAAYQKLSYELIPPPIDRENFLKKLGLEIPQPLTPKELDVVKHLIKGLPAPKIAKELFISSRTVEHHIERIKDKFDCLTKAELIQKIQSLDAFGYLNLTEEYFLSNH